MKSPRFITIKTFADRSGSTAKTIEGQIKKGRIELAADIEKPHIDSTQYVPEEYWEKLYTKK